MSEEGFVRFAVTTYALDEALEARKKEREDEEREEEKKRLGAEQDMLEDHAEKVSLSKPSRVVALVRRPDPRLVMDPALNALLTKPR